MIRKAGPADIDGVTALGLEALENDPYEGLLIDPARVRAVAMEGITAPSNFCWVCEEDGEIVGAVTAIVTDMLFYERKQANVVQFYCKAPGEGAKLLRELMSWARGRPVIKAVLFTLEHRADPRIGKLLTRLGLEVELPVYMEVM